MSSDRGSPAIVAAAVSIAVALVATQAQASTAREILDRVKQLDDTTRHWNDRSQRTTFTTHRATGERRRELKVYDRRVDGENHSVSLFLAPPEEKGTAFLQLTHKSGDSEQWLYVPNVNRVRRITRQGSDETFMGSAFSFRDLDILAKLADWSEDEAPTKLLGEEDVDGIRCDRIELRPRQDGMPYSRVVVSMERDRLIPRKIELLDGRGDPMKTLTLEDVREIGKIPTPHRLTMRNVTHNVETVVIVEDVKYDSKLPAELFTERYLQRGDLASAP